MQQFAFVVLTSGFAFFSSLSGPAHPSRLSLPPRSALLSSRAPLSLSLPRPPSFLRFCFCSGVSCVSLFSGFTIGFPAPQSGARPGHDCSILSTFSTRLALPSPAPWAGHVNSKMSRFRGPNQSPTAWTAWTLSRLALCVWLKLKCHGRSKCRLSTAPVMPIAAQDISPQGGQPPTTQTHHPANQGKAVACRTYILDYLPRYLDRCVLSTLSAVPRPASASHSPCQPA